MSFLKNFLRDESGQDMVEYGLLAAFISIVAIAACRPSALGQRCLRQRTERAALDALCLSEVCFRGYVTAPL